MKREKLPRVVVNLLDRFRDLRHTDLYRLDFFAAKEAEEAIKSTELVIEEITNLIKKGKR